MDIIRKNRLYIILAILITISLFATSAICSQCAGGNLDELETSGGEDGENVEEAAGEDMDAEDTSETEGEESAEDGESTEEEAEEESTEEEEETQSTLEEPTIELIVYEGPVYSQSDDVCYWRVKAIVTGVPTPVVEFNRDDSNGAWGSKKAQVNLVNPTDSYNLSATATNSEGVATDSISLSWQCNRPPEITEITFMGDHFAGIEYTFSVAAADPDGDTLTYSWTVDGGSIQDSTTNPIKWTMPATVGNYDITVVADDGNGGTATLTETVEVTAMLGPPIAAMDVPIVISEGGFIDGNGVYGTGENNFVGDSSTNVAYRGFISFDITGLSGASIDSATLTFDTYTSLGDPIAFTPLWISSVNWEPGPIVPADFNLSGDLIQSFSTPGFTCNVSNLTLYLQNAINGGRDRFQIMLFFTGMMSDSDGSFDIWGYRDNTVNLNVTYTP
ncbi:MAG: putative Ig domain-containing protein [Candidatus Humimicrobiaceae bacterium]